MTSTADLPEPDETLDEILLHYSEAAGGTGGRAILILESDIPALTAAIAAHTKAAVIEARIDTAQTLRKALSPHKGALAIVDNEIKQLKDGTDE